ncbi:hypothetical protein LK06_002930 [Streptomyces pluripotens]|nr:hypothetical protein LK06_002930 [Streptomyces pluripotens]
MSGISQGPKARNPGLWRTGPAEEGEERRPGRSARRKSRLVVTALSVGVVGAGAAWAALALTRETVPARPVAGATSTCVYMPSQAGKAVTVPPYDATKAARPYSVRLVTNRGAITFEALTTRAPCATNSFAYLAGKGYYDQSTCHRVTTRSIFVLECGDPSGKGTADPGYYFKEENLRGASYPAGTVGVSKVVPGRNGSQFFISYADPSVKMPPQWTPFGRVVDGLDVVKEIGANGTQDHSTDGRPRTPVIIESVTVQPATAAPESEPTDDLT